MQRRAKRSYVTEDSTFVTAPSAPRGNHRGPPLFDAHQAEAEQSRLQADSAPSGSGSGSNLPPAPGFGPLPTTPFSSSTATGYPSATGGSAYTYGAGGGGGGSYQPSWAAPSKGGFIDSALGVQAQAWLGWMSRAGRHAFAGMRDATKLMRSIDLVQRSVESASRANHETVQIQRCTDSDKIPFTDCTIVIRNSNRIFSNPRKLLPPSLPSIPPLIHFFPTLPSLLLSLLRLIQSPVSSTSFPYSRFSSSTTSSFHLLFRARDYRPDNYNKLRGLGFGLIGYGEWSSLRAEYKSCRGRACINAGRGRRLMILERSQEVSCIWILFLDECESIERDPSA